MSIILRVRLPTGSTQRLTVPQGADVSVLEALIRSVANELTMEKLELFQDVQYTKPFAMASARHGDMVFIKRDVKPALAPGTSKDVPKPVSGEGAEEGAPRRRCLHGPRGMCENCMPSEDKQERYEAELRKWNGRGMSVAVMEAREALKCKITHQEEPHAVAAAIADGAGHEFQAYLAKTGFTQQRVGFCYGVVNEKMETEVHLIYEPPQNGDLEAYNLLDNEHAKDLTSRAESVAEMLGFGIVGVIFSAKPRKSVLSGKDLVFAARMGSRLTTEQRKGFVVFVVFVTETGETVFEAYQISDLAIELYEKNIFAPEEEQKPNGGKVLCTCEVLVEGRDTKKVHTEFFLMSVPIRKVSSWLRTEFPVESRDLQAQLPKDLSKAIRQTSEPYHRRLSDFHLLLFLSNTFRASGDMEDLVTFVKGETDEIKEGHRLMIESMAAAQ